jgi:hypothetical protein
MSKRHFETSESMRILKIRHVITKVVTLFVRNLFRVRLSYLLLIRSPYPTKGVSTKCFSPCSDKDFTNILRPAGLLDGNLGC